jgi:DNA polymerase III sliding clamp (beta) subunit (PCNA family)
MKIYAPLSALHIVACFAAKQDIRYYLNSVRVEASSIQTRFTATDGHCAGMLRTAQENEGIDGAITILLPIDIVKAAKKAKNNPDALVIETVDGKTGTLAVVGGVSINWSAVDGTFPTMPRVIPAQASGEGEGEVTGWERAVRVAGETPRAEAGAGGRGRRPCVRAREAPP